MGRTNAQIFVIPVRSQLLCFAVARIFTGCVRTRTVRESFRRRLRSSLLLVVPRNAGTGACDGDSPMASFLLLWLTNLYISTSRGKYCRVRGYAKMITAFFRTAILYLLLIVGLRLTG